MRNVLLASVALVGLCGAAHADELANEPHRNVVDDCPLNENGTNLLKHALMNGQYDVTSNEFVAMKLLGFGPNEFTNRTETEQMNDTMIRAARSLFQCQDSVMLTMAKARKLDWIFYDDTLVCLKKAYHKSDAERDARVTAQQRAADAQRQANEQMQKQALAGCQANIEAQQALLRHINPYLPLLPVSEVMAKQCHS